MEFVFAIKEHKARTLGELNISQGEVLIPKQELGNGMSRVATLAGKEGFVPSDLLQKMNDDPSRRTPPATYKKPALPGPPKKNLSDTSFSSTSSTGPPAKIAKKDSGSVGHFIINLCVTPIPRKSSFSVEMGINGTLVKKVKSMTDFRRLYYAMKVLNSEFKTILPPMWSDRMILRSYEAQERAETLEAFLISMTEKYGREYLLASWMGSARLVQTNTEIDEIRPSVQKALQKAITVNFNTSQQKNKKEFNLGILSRSIWDDVEVVVQKGDLVMKLGPSQEISGHFLVEEINGAKFNVPEEDVLGMNSAEAKAYMLGKKRLGK